MSRVVRCPSCGEEELLAPWPELDDGSRPTSCDTCGESWVRDAAPGWAPPRRRAVFVPTSQLDTAAIREAAWRIAEERIAQGWTVPKRDAILRHGIGLYGERAVAHYLTHHGLTVRSIAEDWAAIKDRLGDIEVIYPDVARTVRLEVKTTTPQMWVRRGRLPMQPMQADAVVWCTIPFNAVFVRLLGWDLLPLNDARQPTPRDPADLPDWVKSRLTGPLNDRG